MDKRMYFPGHGLDTDSPAPYSDKSRHAVEEKSQASLQASMEAVLHRQEFRKLGSAGEFVKEQEEKRKDNIHPLPQIRLSVTELKDAGAHPSGNGKITINYSLKSIPENPLFFDCFRGEIDSLGVLITRIQLYLYSKRVHLATENRQEEQSPERHSSAAKWGKKQRG